MYDFLRRPAWIVSHLIVAALIVLAVVLGFWQLSRYQEESAKQDRIDALAADEPVPYDTSSTAGSPATWTRSSSPGSRRGGTTPPTRCALNRSRRAPGPGC
jgi:cytochrome oxidase assembly protein ShyY1